MRTIVVGALGLAALTACQRQRETPTAPAAGEPTRGDTKALVAGAEVLQPMPPVRRLSLHLVGFHPMKDDPQHAMEAHHYCTQLNEELSQCVLFDGPGEDAKMNGVEYIISERLFGELPPDERGFWHPHNYEILSGQLVAPGLPEAAEKAALAKKMNSYGKTFHLWRSTHGDHPGDRLPVGPPALAWSYNADGEMPEALLATRDRRMSIDTAKKRESRRDLVRTARPQVGVDALARAFPGRRKPEGVVDANAAPGRGQGRRIPSGRSR